MTLKPLGRKNYGSIAHLPGSRMGPGDHHCHEGQGRICTVKPRDKHDRIIVTEKLDGSNVGIYFDGEQLHALGRAGYLAQSSNYRQHQLFADWVRRDEERWRYALQPGQRFVGEWLAQAHGTVYNLTHEPFVVFDLMEGDKRYPWSEVVVSAALARATIPHVLHDDASSLSIEAALERLGPLGNHGATDPVEGAVWRVERKGEVDFLAKYVRPDKVDGCYLPEKGANGAEHWNWTP